MVLVMLISIVVVIALLKGVLLLGLGLHATLAHKIQCPLPYHVVRCAVHTYFHAKQFLRWHALTVKRRLSLQQQRVIMENRPVPWTVFYGSNLFDYWKTLEFDLTIHDGLLPVLEYPINAGVSFASLEDLRHHAFQLAYKLRPEEVVLYFQDFIAMGLDIDTVRDIVQQALVFGVGCVWLLVMPVAPGLTDHEIQRRDVWIEELRSLSFESERIFMLDVSEKLSREFERIERPLYASDGVNLVSEGYTALADVIRCETERLRPKV
jgi:hypothetical protein